MTSPKRRIVASAETLYGIDAFRVLSTEERQTLASRCHCQQYHTGQQIVSYLDSDRDVFFIVSGQVQATIFSLAGKQVILQDLNAGQMFGELSAIDGEPRSAHIVASKDSLICSMSPADFLHAVVSYPAVAEATLKRLTSMVRQLSERVFELGALPVKSRIYAELLRISLQHLENEQRAVIEPAPRDADIASHIGTRRENVNKEINHLKRQGLIERDRGATRIIVPDVAKLRSLVQQSTGNVA